MERRDPEQRDPSRSERQELRETLIERQIREVRALLAELPDYRNGPYADLRKWLEGELERTRMRAKVVSRDSLQVRREGGFHGFFGSLFQLALQRREQRKLLVNA